MHPIDKPGRPGAAARRQRDTHVRLASIQSSLHATRLAIARWRCGHGCTEAAADAGPPSPQQRWHADTGRDFCAWLDAGGFSQTTPEPPRHDGASPEALNCLHCA